MNHKEGPDFLYRNQTKRTTILSKPSPKLSHTEMRDIRRDEITPLGTRLVYIQNYLLICETVVLSQP